LRTVASRDVFRAAGKGIDTNVLRVAALIAVAFLCLPSGAIAAAPSGEPARQLLQDVAVRIEAITPEIRGVCTGWIGWSEPTRSVVYTAAHCYEDGATYRVILGNGDMVSVIGLVRWDQEDLMALWIPLGGLRVLRMWKPMPAHAFRALHVVNTPGTAQQIVETSIERVFDRDSFQQPFRGCGHSDLQRPRDQWSAACGRTGRAIAGYGRGASLTAPRHLRGHPCAVPL